ncbi:hypothetical protein J3F84DRAFT_384760 [Trichoderma pleuroticola]
MERPNLLQLALRTLLFFFFRQVQLLSTLLADAILALFLISVLGDSASSCSFAFFHSSCRFFTMGMSNRTFLLTLSSSYTQLFYYSIDLS